jgi:hypothetical protein
MYIAGYDNPGLAEWRVEIREISDGSPSLLMPLADEPTLENDNRIRLRMLVHVNSGILLQGVHEFKLQLGTGDPTVWVDIDETTPITFFNNPTPQDGDALAANSEDPSHDGHEVRNQTYVESNWFTNSVSEVQAEQDAMWDFSLYVNTSVAGDYAFRIVMNNGDELAEYAARPIVHVTGP